MTQVPSGLMGYALAAKVSGQREGGKFKHAGIFHTTLYNPYLASMSPYLAVAKVHIQPFHCILLIVVDGRGPSIYF